MTYHAIVIPTSPSYQEDIERTERALQEAEEKGTKYFIISGCKGEVPLKESQRANIYRRLRKDNIKPSQIRIEPDSFDTRENVLYTAHLLKEKLNGQPLPLKVGFVSYPSHLNRIKDFENIAVKKGLIQREIFDFQRIETNETLEEKIYELNPLRRIYHQFKLATLKVYNTKQGKIETHKPNGLVKHLKRISSKPL